jgi:hypothetical protein
MALLKYGIRLAKTKISFLTIAAVINCISTVLLPADTDKNILRFIWPMAQTQ